MTYEVTLLEADIRDPMDGNMTLGLEHKHNKVAKLEYRWDATQFTAIFHGNAPTLPVSAHPTTLLQRPIAALLTVKTREHRLVTDVFKDHKITIDLSNDGDVS